MSSIAVPARSAWRFYPWVIAGGLAFVMAVNFTMVYIALSTFPGEVPHTMPGHTTASTK